MEESRCFSAFTWTMARMYRSLNCGPTTQRWGSYGGNLGSRGRVAWRPWGNGVHMFGVDDGKLKACRYRALRCFDYCLTSADGLVTAMSPNVTACVTELGEHDLMITGPVRAAAR